LALPIKVSLWPARRSIVNRRSSRLQFGLELRTPIAECLERNTLRLAILPLIQVATLPREMMRSPELLVLTPPRSMLVHISFSPSANRWREEIVFVSY
jgi:hypothetical protein